ncbi:MAG: hypothetical protein LBP59_19280 [Planctomycetaceae bacterium]|jgi:hypothetical protein|nr:hypothetical protein [Planctomycetaceae bacterium]
MNIKKTSTYDIKNRDKWNSLNEWLDVRGYLLKYLPLPPMAFIDDLHFADFVWNYADIYPIEFFTIDVLSDVESVILLCTLDSYFMEYNYVNGCDERRNSYLWCDLRQHFRLTLIDDEDMIIPQYLLDVYILYLNKYKSEKFDYMLGINNTRPFKYLKLGAVQKRANNDQYKQNEYI